MNLTTKQLTSLIAAAVVAVLTVAWMWLGATTILHGRTVIGPNELKALDPGNEGINIVVSQPWFNDSVLVFNIGKPSKNCDFDRLDATRCLLQCAQSLENHDYKRLYLANDWKRMYYINSDDVKSLGQRYRNGDTWNNALLYVELSESVHTLNDSIAFKHDDGLMRAINNLGNWNTMMGNLMR
ncbi:MAG: hypothetical protein II786_02195 [Muribaculaceae bacterium]|nr:hypothetical protein [Muribaculaceae bacterium]